MKVKSKVNTKRLVKNAVYDVIRLNNSTTPNHSYWRNSVKVRLNENKVDSFTVNNFTLEDGSPIPQIDWQSPNQIDDKKYFQETHIKEDNIKSGDYVIYIRNSHASLVSGRTYKVEDVLISKYRNWSDVSLRLEGSKKYYKSYSFRKCTKEESRKLSLNSFFQEKKGFEKVVVSKRKFDTLEDDEKKVIILKVLFTAFLDSNRNSLSLLEWAIKKTGESYKLTKEDFEHYLEYSLKEILNIE